MNRRHRGVVNWRLVVAFCVAGLGFLNFFALMVVEMSGLRAPVLEAGVFFTHLLSMLAVGYIMVTAVFPAFLFAGDAKARAEVVARCRASGERIAAGRFSGAVASLNVNSNLLRVEVWHGGVVVQPVLLPAACVAPGEVLSVEEDRMLFWRGLRLRHTSRYLRGDVFVVCRPDSAVGRALLALSPAGAGVGVSVSPSV